MSEDKDRRVNEDEIDEVEAHHKKTNLANAEAKDEADGGDDDFEAHRKSANI
jgi:hypothetical protein